MPLALCAAFLLSCISTRADLWVTAYYPGYEQAYLTPANIDFTALTHIIHFSLVPNTDGSLNSSANSLTSANATSLVAAAHAAGKKAIVCVGGANSESGFQGATTTGNLSTFVHNLTNFAATYGYDGIDLDWEPMTADDYAPFTNLVNSLRAALDTFPQHKLLTVAALGYSTAPIPGEAEMFASLQSKFDQINIMTYDLSGPWGGWVTWHNAPIYDGNYRFPSTGGLVPSCYGNVTNFVANGIASSKIGIGVAFYGYVWAGGAGTSTGGAALPRQTWTTAPTVSQISYYSLMSTYFQSNLYTWDSAAQAAYLSIDQTGSTNDKFISYDDEHTCEAKVSFARNMHIGGVMIWELGEGYRATQPAGQRDTLLQSIKQAMATPGKTAVSRSGTNIQISFASAPLGLYRVLWSSNAVAPVWNTLTNNVPGTNGPMQVTDPGAVGSQSQRFYKVQTPP